MTVSAFLRSLFPALAGTVLLFAAPAFASEDEVKPMTFQIVPGGADFAGRVMINARGEFTDDTARDFSLFVANSRLKGLLPKEPRRSASGEAAPAPRIVVGFSSIGGKVVPALIMGRRIRSFGWTTVVGQARDNDGVTVIDPAECYSACSMVMLGGPRRYIVPGSREGLHQFQPVFEASESFNADEMNQIVRDYGRQVVGVYDYVHEMGVDVGFFITTLRTPFTSMDEVPKERWMEIGLVTAMLPDGDGATTLHGVLDGATQGGLTASVAAPPAPAPEAAPAATSGVAKQSALEAPAGVWTVRRQAEGSALASFSTADVALSMSCLKADAARLEITFKDLDPVDLEHMRAAAFSTKRLRLAHREIAIDSVGAPGRGEQGLAALLGHGDIEALRAGGTLTLAVLDRAGAPAGRSASVASGAQAVSDLMAGCAK